MHMSEWFYPIKLQFFSTQALKVNSVQEEEGIKEEEDAIFINALIFIAFAFICIHQWFSPRI